MSGAASLLASPLSQPSPSQGEGTRGSAACPARVSRARRAAVLAILLAVCAAGLRADTSLPTPLRDVGYDQRLGAQVPLDLAFRDEAGRPVRLGELVRERPAVLLLAYYTCPMLCTVVLEGAAASLRVIPFTAGRDFDVVVVSFDPRDTARLAAAKKSEVVARYARPEGAAGWHFLTGSAPSIAVLTRTVGFRYYFDDKTGQYAHAAGLVLLTPTGRISRYFYGVEFPARDLRLGLVEASGEKIGSLVDQVLLFCYHYDPVIGRYSAMTLNLVRAGGAATVLGLALAILLMRRRERRPESPRNRTVGGVT
jgi:protein SCO1